MLDVVVISGVSCAAMLVNKVELARVLGCSLPTVGEYIARWPAFPVAQRGALGREWQFEADDVVAFLAERDQERRAAEAAREQQLQQYSLQLGGEPDEPPSGLSVSDRLALARLRRIEREEGEACGRLVRREELQATLQEMFRTLREAQRSALRRFAEAKGFDSAATDELIKALDTAIRESVDRLRQKLGASTPERSEGPRLVVDNERVTAQDDTGDLLLASR